MLPEHCHRIPGRTSGLWDPDVPKISRLLGIVISMVHNDHDPPHFHARYGKRQAEFSIDPLQLTRGRLPPRVVGLVMEWTARHRLELLEDWERARSKAPLRRIPPWSRAVSSDVVAVEYLGGHRLLVRFDDHLEWKAISAPLRDPECFAQARVVSDTGTIE